MFCFTPPLSCSSTGHPVLFSFPEISPLRGKYTMAGLLVFSSHPYISLLHKTPCLLHPRSLHPAFRRNPKLSRFPLTSAGKARRIRIDCSSRGDDEDPIPLPRLSVFTDEWGERSEPEAELPAESDPPKNDDEWGSEGISGGGPQGAPMITDEWGEKTELEPEEPTKPDPLVNEDEWGNGRLMPDDKLGELKRCLVDTIYGTELGFRASSEVRGEIVELVSQLEAHNPTPAPNESPELLDGNWILLYTAFSELSPLLIAVGATPALKIKKISQSIDCKNRTIVNATTLAAPFTSFSFSASASFEVQSPSRIQVQFKEGAFHPQEVTSTLNLTEKIEIFGQNIGLQPVQQSLNPIQQALANMFRVISGQPPLMIPIPGNREKSWLLTTYLDRDFRISRGDRGLFVLAKEGSPLLDLLS